MAVKELFQLKKKSGRSIRPSQIPKKRTINLVPRRENEIKVSILIPGVIIIAILAAMFSKFAVVDRLNAVSLAEAEADRLQQEVEEAYRSLENYGDLKDEYAHYTWSGLTDDELALANREAVMNLIQKRVLKSASVKSWKLNGNELNIPITCPTLSEINAVAAQLEKDPLVGFCTVTTAATNAYSYSSRENDGMVTAQITVYLRSPEEMMAIGGLA